MSLDSSQEDARSIVERLLGPEQAQIELEDDLVISDLEADAMEFTAELDFMDRIGEDIPAVRLADEGLVPVSLTAIFGPLWSSPPYRRFYEYEDEYYFWWRWIRDWLKKSGSFHGLVTMPGEMARSTFLRRATDFLAIRIATIRDFRRREQDREDAFSLLNLPQRARGPRVLTPGCNFTVSTNSAGLRVFWSGAYWISPNYFSHPTTPAVGVLQSGTYVFGVDGSAYGDQIQWDFNAVVTLPGNSRVHLNF